MARGRMLDQRFTQSDKLNDTPRDHRLIYASLLPYLDRKGRMCAEPMVVKVTVFRRSDFTIEEIADALNNLAKAGLIRLYADKDNEAILEVTDFLKFNSPNSRERDSDFPGPDDSGAQEVRDTDLLNAKVAATQTLPTDSPRATHVQSQRGAQGNGTERERLTVNEERNKHSSPEIEPQPLPALAATPPRESHDPGLFMHVWNQHRGRLPAVTTLNAKRKAAIRGLVKEHGPDTALDLLRDATRAVANDDFWLERQYGFDNLLTGKVVARAEQWRSSGSLSNADRKLAAMASRLEAGRTVN